jgi:hypothetical protein
MPDGILSGNSRRCLEILNIISDVGVIKVWKFHGEK